MKHKNFEAPSYFYSPLETEIINLYKKLLNASEESIPEHLLVRIRNDIKLLKAELVFKREKNQVEK